MVWAEIRTRTWLRSEPPWPATSPTRTDPVRPIRVADLPAPWGRRYVLVLTRRTRLAVVTAVMVAPITGTRRGLPTELAFRRADDGFDVECVATLDNVQTIDSELPGEEVGVLAPGREVEPTRAVMIAMDLAELDDDWI